MFLLSDPAHMKRLEGYFLQHCAVIDAHRLSLVLRNIQDSEAHDSLEERSVRKRAVRIQFSPDGTLQSNSFTISNAEKMFAAHSGSNRPDTLFVNGNGEIYLFNGAGVEEETTICAALGIAEDGFRLFGVSGINDMVYVCGLNGLVARRTANGMWQDLSVPARFFSGVSRIMVGVDGFGPDDLYALSWKAGLFHFNGEKWRPVAFPSNIPLETVCCGANGVVYVSGKSGTIFAGRESRWDLVHTGSLSLPFTNSIWHDDALWGTNDYGVWTFRDGVFDRAPVPDEVYICSGHLSARDGLLLLGGLNGAAIHDDNGWRPLYYQPEIIAKLLPDTEQ